MLNSAETQSALAAIRGGATLAEAAEASGLHPSSIYRRMRRQGVKSHRCKPPRLSGKEKATIRRLLDRYSRREVAEQVGRGLGTVSRVATDGNGSGLTRSARRCPGCGYLIRTQRCLICVTRNVA